MRNRSSAQRRPALAFPFLLAAGGLAASAPADAPAAPRSAAGKLTVCTTVPSLASVVAEVGGDHVAVTSFAKGTENPHFVDARPSFVKTLSGADLYVQQGLDLEVGWAPLILQQSRNARVQRGSDGFLDVSAVVERLDVPTGPVDRSMGDVHAYGNPHYMTDPVNGIAVARAIRDRLAKLRPEAAADFERGCSDFEKKLCVALVGEKLAGQYPTDTVVKLARLHETGRLGEFLREQGKQGDLGGWLGALLPYAGTKAISDHNSWAYFGRRFGIQLVGYLEPKPGIAPTTAHLGEIVKLVPQQGVALVIVSPGFDPKAGQLVASRTGAKLVKLAHEVGAVDDAGDYVRMLDYDVRQIVQALQQS